MKLTSTFTDAAYPDAARAYGQGEMDQKAWDKLAKRPLFQVWLRGVLHRHFEGACAACAHAVENKP